MRNRVALGAMAVVSACGLVACSTSAQNPSASFDNTGPHQGSVPTAVARTGPTPNPSSTPVAKAKTKRATATPIIPGAVPPTSSSSAGKVKTASWKAGTENTAASTASTRVIGYYANWDQYNSNGSELMTPDVVPATQITHLNYAFAGVSGAGGTYVQNGTVAGEMVQIAPNNCYAIDQWGDLDAPLTVNGTSYDGGYAAVNSGLKAENSSLKTLLSIGGWTQNQYTSSGTAFTATPNTLFSAIAADSAATATFVQSCVQFAKAHGFDGVDIDWEYPVSGGAAAGSAADTANYTTLLQAFRSELTTEYGSGLGLLSATVPSSAAIMANEDLSAVAGVVDSLNLMGYDYNGCWNTFAAHNAPLYSNPSGVPPADATFDDQSAIETLLTTYSVPAAKINMGVPFYGHTFSGATTGTNNGLFEPTTGCGPGNGSAPYYNAIAPLLSGYTTEYDAVSEVPYAYNSAGDWVSYDDAQSMNMKGAFIDQNGLGGAMIWVIEGDTSTHTLVSALNSGLGGQAATS